MKWQVTKQYTIEKEVQITKILIEDERGEPICSICPSYGDSYSKIIANSPNMYEAIKECLETSNSSKGFSKRVFDKLSDNNWKDRWLDL